MRAIGFFLGVTAVVTVAGCKPSAPPPMPPAEVEAITIAPEPLMRIVEVPGRVQAIRTAEVRARVDGIIERRVYVEGSDVRAGAPLFNIDPKPLRAQANAASAALRRAEAEAANASRDVARFQPLVARNAISQQEFDAARARADQAAADVRSAQAQLEQAQLNLGYATVTAPISGRAGRAQVTEGALASATQGTLLTTIEQIDTVYVNFSQSSNDLMALRRDIEAGRLSAPAKGRTRVTLELEDGTVFDQTGYLDFADMSVDPMTGTVSQRAEFPNPRRTLLPGEFVRARIEAGMDANGIAVPQRAVMLTAQGASVMIVSKDNRALPQPIKLGPQIGHKWTVIEGLKPGDRVVTEGLIKLQPGMSVKVVPAVKKQAN